MYLLFHQNPKSNLMCGGSVENSCFRALFQIFFNFQRWAILTRRSIHGLSNCCKAFKKMEFAASGFNLFREDIPMILEKF